MILILELDPLRATQFSDLSDSTASLDFVKGPARPSTRCGKFASRTPSTHSVDDINPA